MSLPEFEAFLRRTIGLDVASVTPAMVERSVRGRMAARGLPDPGSYLELLRSSEAELQELIETVVIPETWFFRDREVFATLAKIAAEGWPSVGARPGGLLRLLSLPCATGEEPYSMAMALLDAGLPPERFRVDAVDISLGSLQRAQHAVYGRNSFRGDDIGFRERHFHKEGAGWRLDERVRSQVHFTVGNLIDSFLLSGTEIYDAVFCRNVLIYFGTEARDRVIATLDRLLAPEGLLFMGPSETSLLPERRFRPARLPRAFAFYKAKAGSPQPPVGASPRKRARSPVAASTSVPPPAPKPAPFPLPLPLPVSVPAASPAPADPARALDEAMRLADQGRLAEAAALCEAHLREHGPSARGFYLLGLVRDAARDHREAAALYRKALYIDPKNQEVLFHLASLLESQGAAQEAKLLNDRARRLAVNGKEKT